MIISDVIDLLDGSLAPVNPVEHAIVGVLSDFIFIIRVSDDLIGPDAAVVQRQKPPRFRTVVGGNRIEVAVERHEVHLYYN